jgi:drug/metabolite transporter (DMT)-like permease
VLGLRFGIGAAASFLVLQLSGRPLLPAPGERVRVFLLGAVGYAVESSCFFGGLQRGSAAAVALIFYSYPTMVALVERHWTSRTAVTLVLSAAGSAVIVTAGGGLHISRTGAMFAFAAALAFSAYLISGHRFVHRTDSLTTSAWVAAGASLSLVTRGVVTGTLQSPGGHWPALIANGLASGTAFALMFAALRRIGPRRTGIVMTLEAFFTIALAAAFLGEGIGPLQVLGGAAILTAAVITGLEPMPAPTL